MSEKKDDFVEQLKKLPQEQAVEIIRFMINPEEKYPELIKNESRILEIQSFLKEFNETFNGNSVFHYTKGDALYNILKNKELILSERNFMNDIKEVEYTKNVFSTSFGDDRKSICDLYLDSMFDMQQSYIFSASMEEDSISMWSYYANEPYSYCLEFDKEKLAELFSGFNENNNSKLSNKEMPCEFNHGKVIYDKDKQQQIFRKITFYIYQRSNLKHDDFIIRGYNDICLLDYFFSMCKQKGHHHENEYRFVFSVIGAKQDDFVVRNGMFVPVKKIKFEDKKLPIKSIRIGPKNYNSVAENGLKLFLKSCGYDDVEVKKSELSIR